MDKINFSCIVDNTIPSKPINLQILLDNAVMFKSSISSKKKISFLFDDEKNNHREIKFLISGKDNSYVMLDNTGNIINSAELLITNISFNDTDITDIITISPLEYKHNYNGNGETVTGKFYNTAGCNGEITLNFSTPIYLWLLENM